MMYGSEIWPMKKGHESMLERTEMRMVRWMCGTSLREKKSSAELHYVSLLYTESHGLA